MADSVRREALLAVVENAVRLARAAGASEDEIGESVRWALSTPELAVGETP